MPNLFRWKSNETYFPLHWTQAMQEKAPLFTVTDRRKFTTDGELRPGVVASEPPAETPPAPPAPAETIQKAAHEAAHPEPVPAAATPSPAPPAAAPAQPEDAFGDEEGMLPEPTAAESAEQHAAYQESSRGLDELVAKPEGTRRGSDDL
jgi:hypothetical protein